MQVPPAIFPLKSGDLRGIVALAGKEVNRRGLGGLGASRW